MNIEQLRSEEQQLNNRLAKIRKAIEAIQDVCTHEKGGKSTMDYDGHDSHNDYYKCTLCGKEESR